MRVKTMIEKALRSYPPAFRLGSKVYHTFHFSFRSVSAEAPWAIKRAIEKAKQVRGDDPGDYYEFGIFRGFTFLTAYKVAEEMGLETMRFYGFDSFEGLPDAEGIDKGNGQFFKGQFACSERKVKANLVRNGMNLDRASFVKGYYNESLTEELRGKHPFREAAVVMFDCDLYASTVDALTWVAPYLGAGTVLVFDDWKSFGGGPESGQPKAFREYLSAHKDLRAEEIFDYKHHGLVFVLRKV